MLVIFRGFGLLAIALPYVGLLLTQLVADHLMGRGYYASHVYLRALGGLLGGVLTLMAARLLRGTKRLTLDVDTGDFLEVERENSLFWLPLGFWGLVTCLLCLYLLARTFQP